MIYSATVSQLVNSIESHSIGFDGGRPRAGSDSIGTRSIANSAGSHSSSCKSISDPTVLLSKAVLDLKRSARQSEDMSEEYWDTWNYWKRHPFVTGNVLLSGQLLLEHLLILTNLNYEGSSVLFQELKDWLQLLSSNPPASQPEIVQIRDQLCAGFFLIYCKRLEEAEIYLAQVEVLILPEYFDALKGELEKRKEEQRFDSAVAIPVAAPSKPYTKFNSSNYSQILPNFFLFIREFASALLERMKARHAFLVAAIRSNAKNFFLFCKKLIEILLKRIRIL